jgi:hypothetical protein
MIRLFCLFMAILFKVIRFLVKKVFVPMAYWGAWGLFVFVIGYKPQTIADYLNRKFSMVTSKVKPIMA